MSSPSSSDHSLRSKGVVDLVEFNAALNTKKNRKKAAHWTEEQESALLDVLLDHLPSMGDGNFKKQTYVAAAAYLQERFPCGNQEGEKTADTCERKFKAVSNLPYRLLLLIGFGGASSKLPIKPS